MPRIIGSSRPLLEAFERIRRAAATGVTVLLTGESGTGKELVAAAIHAGNVSVTAPSRCTASRILRARLLLRTAYRIVEDW